MDVDLNRLDLNLLVALDRLLSTGNVTTAADALGVTQPAMSRTLQRLRDALGDPLLVRVGRQMVLTDRARALAEPLHDALTAVERVFAPPARFDPLTARGTLDLALGDEAQQAFLPALTAALTAAAPGIDLRIHTLRASSLEDGRRGVIDLALAPDLSPLPKIAGGVDYDEFVARPLYTRRFVVASGPGGPPTPVSRADWLAARHVIVTFTGGGRGFVDELLAAEGLSRRVALGVTSFPAAAAVIAATDLVGMLPEELIHTSTLHASPPPIEIPALPMLLLWHPRRTPDPRHRFLRELVGATIKAEVARWGGE